VTTVFDVTGWGSKPGVPLTMFDVVGEVDPNVDVETLKFPPKVVVA